MEPETPNLPLPTEEQPLRQPYRHIWIAAALGVIKKVTNDDTWSLDESTEARPQLPVALAAHWELNGPLNGKLQLKLHREAAREWARLLLPPDAPAPSARGEISELEQEKIAQVLRQFAQAMAAGLKEGGWGEVQIQFRHLGPLRRAIEDGGAEYPLRFIHPSREPLELDLCLDSALREQFRQGPKVGFDPAPAAPIATGRLDLLLDVELDVTLRFGGRQMLLHDVLELAPGSVLELDRHIDDPVELLVAGKVIAWGEVVVVDGNYGLRITRLVHRAQRMAAVGAAV